MRALALVLVAGLFAAACGQQANNSGGVSKHGGTLHVAIGIDPDTMDPMRQTTTTVQNIVDMVAEPLVTIDEKGAVKPLLAEKWDVSGDGLQYTFTLRTGVKFHDGTPFNAQAAKTSFDRILDPKNTVPLRGILNQIASTAAVDDSHFKITLKAKLASIISALTQTSAAILSPQSLTAAGNTYAQAENVVGTGPYKLKSRTKGDRVTLVKNDAYWGTKPNYDVQEFKVVPEAASREALVRSGQADMIILPPVADIPALQSNSSLKVLVAPSDRTIFIAVNTVSPDQPLLQKSQVRQALNYAVDKKAIIKSVLFGAADPLDAPAASSLLGYCKAGSYEHNPSKAKSLLEQAGAAGMSVKLMSPTGRYIQDIQAANAIAGNLREVGIKVEGPATSDWPSYLGTINVPPPGTAQLHLLGWAPGYLDAQQQMEQFYSQRQPPKGLSTSYYTNPAVDQLIGKANSESDTGARKKDYCDAEKQIWNDAPWIFLWTQKFPIVYSNKVTGIGSFPTEKFNTVYAQPA
jgi:peptide/nickel transport system substrate-binding protein